MTFNKLLILLTAFALFLTACGGGNTTPNSNTATNSTNAAPANTTANSTEPASNSAVATKAATPAPLTNDAPTVKPVVLAYYEALKTKNEEALKKVYSKQTLASLEDDMKADGEKSLIKFITDIEPAPAQPYEVRNEQVNGDVIVAEMISPQYKNGIKIKFVKENGEWKLTNESPDFQKK